jgi:hypothetical protein
MEEVLGFVVMLVTLAVGLVFYLVFMLVNHLLEEWDADHQPVRITEWGKVDYRGVVVNEDTDADGYSNNEGAWLIRLGETHYRMTWERPGDDLPRVRSESWW